MKRVNVYIETDRMILREVCPLDAGQTYIKGLNDPDVVRLTEARHVHWTKKKVLDYIVGAKKGGYYLVGLFLRKNNRHIGNIRLVNIHPIHRRTELGIMIFDKTAWGKGYGTEALKAMVEFVFSSLGFHRIHADYYAVNKASKRIFENAGFQVEGVYRDHFLLGRRYIDSVRVAKIRG